MDVSTILNLIDISEFGLPQFQRGYVWNRWQVRRFMSSLYRENPVGSLLIWVTNTSADIRGNADSSNIAIKLLVDGQQRITTLYGIARGKTPAFFFGDEKNFLNLYFNLDSEEFEFYGPIRMRDDPRWVSVTEVFQKGAGKFLEEKLLSNQLKISDLGKLNQLEKILKKDFHIEEITNKELDEVVEIFNEVNSGGTKLSSADLALAKISAKRPHARDEMHARLHKWGDAGYWFSLEWLLRGITAMRTGDSRYRAIDDITSDEFDHGLQRYEKHVDNILLQIRANLGLDHDFVLRSVYSFPLLARYLELNGGFRQGAREIARTLFWYIHTVLWGRYSGSTESILLRDLNILRDSDAAEAQIQGLIDALQSERGTLELSAADFHASWSNNRFYPLLYMLTRVCGARDLNKNIPLSMNLLGNPLERHHIFPRSRLYKAKRSRRDVHRLANFAFLTRESNREISDALPKDYFAKCEAENPGVLASQWIPMDEWYWELENYHAFLEWRQERLAVAANQLLQQLNAGELPLFGQSIQAEHATAARPAHIASDEEERQLRECQNWLQERGLPMGELGYELVDDETSELYATLDIAWPQGMQSGLTQPVALLIDEDAETHNIIQQRGFRYFTNPADFKRYVEREILAH